MMRIALLTLTAGLMATSCTVADCLSDEEILEELDEIVRVEGSGDSRRIVYRERAILSSWYMRFALLAPVRGALAMAFGRRRERDLDNPGQHVRELLRELPDETGARLLSCAAATSRFGWLAELDRNAETRILSIDGLAAVCRQLEIDPFASDLNELGLPADAQELAAARESIKQLRASNRKADASDIELEPYRTALRAISARPLDQWAMRLLLIEDLAVLYVGEPDPRVQPWIEDALRRSIGHCVGGILVRTIEGRARELAEVRLCAMEQIRRLGGPRTVPMMLSAMAASPAQLAAGEEAFDPDSLVRLRLIHYCGQLDAELARSVVKLPGRKDWEATAPVEFLARTVLNERGYYSKLRTPALVALTWCLQRKAVDPDPQWVREWLDSRGS